MKHGKRPTRAQKMRLQRYCLSPENWLVVKDCSDRFVIVNRLTGQVRVMKRSVVEDEA